MSKTTYLDSVALAQGWTVADIENQALANSASLTSATDTASIAKGATEVAFAFASEPGWPNSSDWPAASGGDPYKSVISVNSIGADLSLNAAINRVTSDLATLSENAVLTLDSSTGTGLKTGTNTVWNPGAGSATNRAAVSITVINGNAHNAQSLVLDLGTTATYMQGPWADATTGTAATTHPATTVSVSGWVEARGTAAASLNAATVSAEGTSVLNVTGTAAVTTNAVTASVSGWAEATGTAAVATNAATVSASGAEIMTGTAAAALPAPTVSGSGAEAMTGTAAVTGGAASVSGSGWAEITGTSALTGQAATISATGAEEFTATAAVTLPATTVSGTGSSTGAEEITGTAALTLPATTTEASGAEAMVASAAATLAGTTVSGTGWAEITGTGAVLMAAVAADATAEEAITGTGAIALPVATLAGSGTSGDVIAPTFTIGRHREPPTPAPIQISGVVTVSLSAARVAGTGAVNDDELALTALLS